MTTLSATGQAGFHQYFTPFTEGFAYADPNLESVQAQVDQNTCAVMIELIQGEGGVCPLDKGFVQALAAFCKERDILLVVDEVQTGVGRTGKLYCYEHYGVQPDVITSAKGLGGGLPDWGLPLHGAPGRCDGRGHARFHLWRQPGCLRGRAGSPEKASQSRAFWSRLRKRAITCGKSWRPWMESKRCAASA